MEFRKIIEDLGHFQTIMMVEMKDNPELSNTIEKFSNNLHRIYDEVFFKGWGGAMAHGVRLPDDSRLCMVSCRIRANYLEDVLNNTMVINYES